MPPSNPRSPRVACTIHDVIETDHEGNRVYPYRCSRCGGCNICQHKQIGYTHRVCRDGAKRHMGWDPGVIVVD